MTKIYFKDSNRENFYVLCNGDFFRFGNELFIKISEIFDRDNAICLSDGCIASFNKDEEIVPIDNNKVTITVED